MKSAYRRFAYPVFVAAWLVPTWSGAVDFGFTPRVEAGAEYYKIKFENVNFIERPTSQLYGTEVSESERKFKDIQPFVGLGFTMSADRFYIDLYGQKADNFSDTDRFETGVATSRPPAFVGAWSPTTHADFDRKEWSLSAGYRITDHWSVYGGYKKAKTDFKEQRQGLFGLDFPVSLGENEVFPTHTLFLEGTFREKFDYDFRQKGPYVATAYTWDLDLGPVRGFLTTNLGIAFLDGDFRNTSRTSFAPSGVVNEVGLAVFENIDEELETRSSFSGDTVGLNFGVQWAGATGIDGLSYTVGARAYQYNFDADEDTSSDVTETVAHFSLGVSYTF